MKRFLVKQIPPIIGQEVRLPDSEAHHALQVYRLRDGDRVEAVDGQGGGCVAILRVDHRSKDAEIWLQRIDDLPILNDHQSQVLPICLEVAVLKGDAMEWVIEKSVELGVQEVRPFVSDHTVVQIQKKGGAHFQERWQKIADQALKQSERLVQMKVSAPRSIAELFAANSGHEGEICLWAAERVGNSTSLGNWVLKAQALAQAKPKRVRLLVGPEGGFSAAEKEWLMREKTIPVNLGPTILRAETAVLYGLSLISVIYRA